MGHVKFQRKALEIGAVQLKSPAHGPAKVRSRDSFRKPSGQLFISSQITPPYRRDFRYSCSCFILTGDRTSEDGILSQPAVQERAEVQRARVAKMSIVEEGDAFIPRHVGPASDPITQLIKDPRSVDVVDVGELPPQGSKGCIHHEFVVPGVCEIGVERAPLSGKQPSSNGWI